MSTSFDPSDPMDLLEANLHYVQIPEPTNRVYKHECCISFDTPKSEGGLFVDMNSFLAFGEDYVGWNYEKTGSPVYLHIKEIQKPVIEDALLLAIGVEGGPGNSDPEYELIYKIVILPGYAKLPFPYMELPIKVSLAVEAVITNAGAERKEQVATWAADTKLKGKQAMDSEQLDDGTLVPTSVQTEITTAEKELDQNTDFNWNRIQESGQEVEPLAGPGYTGLVNLGNSCYLAATMQVVFSTRGFRSRYYSNQSLDVAFDNALVDPTVDLNMQLTKLAHGLLSGKYSNPATKKQEGIPPGMFKSLISAKHPEFSTTRQQDALEFFLHFLDQVEQSNTGNPKFDPSRSFKFGIEERLKCPSGKVSYNKRDDYILSLDIPLHKATNKKELEEFQEFKAEKDAKGEELSSDEIVRPRVPLMDCLDCFSAPVELHDFFSTALNAKTTAIKTAGLTSFPDYLVLHMRKFVVEEGGVPKKLDVCVDVPDIIDINHMRSKGLQPGEELLPGPQPGEELLPDTCMSKPALFLYMSPLAFQLIMDFDDMGTSKLILDLLHLSASDDGINANEDIVLQLASKGFQYFLCKKAVLYTFNTGVEAAMNWLLDHMYDPDINAPIVKEQMLAPVVDKLKLRTLLDIGIDELVARKALQESGGDVEKAAEWVYDPSVRSSMDTTCAPSSSTTAVTETRPLPDGEGRYRLKGIVSHIGTSIHCGHYVAHIYKDGRWVIFDDDKVGASKNPPIDMAYLYFLERIES
ncbi:hypothetical protein RD792_002778 [Penstemon davidsonii]|uniref:Ubiquitin carboxyl-terminal hydrolase n=1 Tax=Penstemon davidsonii TaxID=160366 RepID=A0ABR0DS77_9LAMI|nr:hypothetical protein RD792_002778 [Penstemon davidsonii]